MSSGDVAILITGILLCFLWAGIVCHDVTKKEENVNDLEVSITLEADTETKQQYLSVNTEGKTVSVKLVDLDGSPYTKTANNGDFDKRFTVTKSNKKLIIDDNEVGQRYTIDDGVKVEKIEE